jgi:hypothetical protein
VQGGRKKQKVKRIKILRAHAGKFERFQGAVVDATHSVLGNTLLLQLDDLPEAERLFGPAIVLHIV